MKASTSIKHEVGSANEDDNSYINKNVIINVKVPGRIKNTERALELMGGRDELIKVMMLVAIV